MALDTNLRKVASALYEHLNTDIARKCNIFLKHELYGELAAMAVDPADYSCTVVGAEEYRRDSQACNFLRKSRCLTSSDLQPVRAARQKFFESEELCARTNRFFQRMRLIPDWTDCPVEGRLRHILQKAEKIIARVLGPIPSDIKPSFGPGTCFELKGSTSKTLADKFWVTPRCTQPALALFEHYFWPSAWGRSRLAFGLALPDSLPGNYFTCVPKTAATHRGICVEPLGNLWLQLGVGAYIKKRLGRVGIHVSPSQEDENPTSFRVNPWIDGQKLHRELARDGSTFDSWATIDLSSASDTVSLELVRWLLPAEWFDLLFTLRCPKTFVPGLSKKGDSLDWDTGEWVELHKFSSMGNGFTFELESLIFWSLTRATLESAEDSGTARRRSERSCAVYGDDIICPQEIAWELTTVLNYCGFEINLSKSFYEGNFYESCGRHFFDGSDVTPIYQKEVLQDEASCIRGYNRLVRYALRDLSSGYCSTVPVFNSALRLFEKVLDRHRTIPFLPFGADGDDGYLLSDEYILLRLKPGYCANRGLRCTVRSNKLVGIPADELALYTYNLRVIHNRPVRNLVKDYRDNCFQDLLLAQPMTTDSSGYFDSRDEHTLMRSDSHRWVSLG